MVSDDDNNKDDLKKVITEEWRRRVENGTITAAELMAQVLDVHKEKTNVGYKEPPDHMQSVMVAWYYGHFFVVYYKTHSSRSDYFQYVIDSIQDKYFNPAEGERAYADADIASVEIGPYTYVIMKKQRITKEQIAEELYQDRSEYERRQMIEVIKGLDPETYNRINGIPFVTGSIEEDQTMLDIVKALFDEYKSII
jgi:hypothetical protein